MAGNRTLKLSILADVDDLKKKLGTADNEVQGFGDKLGKFGKIAGAAFAAAGAAAVAYAGKLAIDGVKAAIEDEAAQLRLATALKNVTGATDDQIAATEDYITKTTLATGVTDDELRPSLQRLVTATNDIAAAQKLQAIALDVSAGSGKSLEAVTLAMGKSFNGSDTALIKLMPSLKGSKDAINDLATATAGAAATAANTDPYMRMTAIFANLQEKVGAALLPALGKLSTWLASPGGVEALTIISDALVQIITDGIAVAKWAVANKNWLLPLAAGIGAVTAAWNVASAAAKAYAAVAAIAAAAGAAGGAGGLLSKIPLGVGIGLGAVGTAAGILSLKGDSSPGGTGGGVPSPTASPQRYAAYQAELAKAPGVGTNLLNTKSTSSGITVNVTQAVTAKTIVDTVAAYSKSTGTSLSSLLR